MVALEVGEGIGFAQVAEYLLKMIILAGEHFGEYVQLEFGLLVMPVQYGEVAELGEKLRVVFQFEFAEESEGFQLACGGPGVFLKLKM